MRLKFSNELPTIALVEEFHLAFRGPIAAHPMIPSLEVRKLRAKLIIEELGEYLEATGFKGLYGDYCIKELMDYVADTHERSETKVNIIEAADALADIDYVVAGANLAFGFPAYEIIKHVHESNMSKLGEDGQPMFRADGKILKGPNYFKPDIASILAKYPAWASPIDADKVQTR